jgi:uncharacterized protein YdhG (YjbR/CyaY superfamily)
MNQESKSLNNVESYIAGFPPEIQSILQNVRQIIREEVPEAEEKISYQMPTYHFIENLVHFAAFKKHLGFYPTPSGIAAFEDELGGFKHAKGSVQFPFDRPIPYDLIRRIVQFRKQEVSG